MTNLHLCDKFHFMRICIANLPVVHIPVYAISRLLPVRDGGFTFWDVPGFLKTAKQLFLLLTYVECVAIWFPFHKRISVRCHYKREVMSGALSFATMGSGLRWDSGLVNDITQARCCFVSYKGVAFGMATTAGYYDWLLRYYQSH